MYKITNNLLDINPNQYLMPGHSQTRSNHPHKYRQILTSHNYPVLQIQFFPRTIAQWNRLPSSVFAHNSLDTFKGALQDINLTIAPFRHLQKAIYTTTPPLPSPVGVLHYHITETNTVG
ncbi:hypothetical protein NP493_3350g00004 [Ridgeia piscesae]|uniref:Uncharacterized protein n=1 Tax=Ridgeia piscesae TaxID=27915 RepID=A0AAD9J8Y9_RIDPI|nr:hypothetical protein NP493_3350g00004 [Ridgeia piscesae]